MPGRHKWNDLKASLTPERRERMAEKTAEMRAVLPPVTYDQVRWAANEYNKGDHRYNEFYRAVYEPDFPHSLLKRGSNSDVRASDVKPLLEFLNRWKSRRPHALAHPIAAAIPHVGSHLRILSDASIEASVVNDAVFDATELAFDRLTSIRDVGPTTASKILGVLHPRFFVMWDTPIQRLYFRSAKCDGRAYVIFMKEMRNSALSIVSDASKREIEDPAETISEEINLNPPFTLAKFVNDYVWLTVTRKKTYPPFDQHQEHYA